MELVRLTNLVKSFHGRPIYSSASTFFESGAITAVTGPNGSGKSLLFRMICGFVRPDAGEVWVDPRFMSPRNDYPSSFGVIIDQPGFIPNLSGMANLQMLANIRKIIRREEVARSMTEFGLDPHLKQKVRHYSLGMRQKLALAQAFMERPEVLVLDEPFNALDAEAVVQLHARIRQFQRQGGSVIFSSHSKDDVDALADDVVTVDNGRLERR